MKGWTVYKTNGGTCDGCGKQRRTLYVAGTNPWDGEVEHAICFFCTKKVDREIELRESDLAALASQQELEALAAEAAAEEQSYDDFYSDL